MRTIVAVPHPTIFGILAIGNLNRRLQMVLLVSDGDRSGLQELRLCSQSIVERIAAGPSSQLLKSLAGDLIVDGLALL
jgi:hypothetical protein